MLLDFVLFGVLEAALEDLPMVEEKGLLLVAVEIALSVLTVWYWLSALESIYCFTFVFGWMISLETLVCPTFIPTALIPLPLLGLL